MSFFCSQNRKSFFSRKFLLAKFSSFKAIKTNLKCKRYQHQSGPACMMALRVSTWEDNEPIWNCHDMICLWSNCFCFACEISKVWYFIKPIKKKKKLGNCFRYSFFLLIQPSRIWLYSRNFHRRIIYAECFSRIWRKLSASGKSKTFF